MSPAAAAATALAATALSGCTNDDPGPAAAPTRDVRDASSTLTVARTRSAGDDAGRLAVTVVAASGSRVLNASGPVGPAGTLERARIRAGDYTLTARPQTGESCAAPVRVPPASAVTATVVAGATGRCHVVVRYVAFGDLVGRKPAPAAHELHRRGFDLRVVRRGGRPLVITRDLSYRRVNVAVAGGRIERVDGLY